MFEAAYIQLFIEKNNLEGLSPKKIDQGLWTILKAKNDEDIGNKLKENGITIKEIEKKLSCPHSLHYLLSW